MKIRTLIVDDEPLARQRLRRLLEADPHIAVVGESADGQQAVEDLRTLGPDLVFLDVQMPGLDGFGVLKALGKSPLPAIIFVTAHDRFALQAFEVHALDYLLKPFDKDRFASAVERAKTQLRQGSAAALDRRLQELLQSLSGRKAAERLVVKSAGRAIVVRIGDIDWVEAAGNYVKLHVGEESYLLRESLTGVEKHLDPVRFVRIHRSTIVNIECIRDLQPLFHGDYVVTLTNGTELPLSRGCRDKLEELLGHAF